MRDIIPHVLARHGVNHANNGFGWNPATGDDSICCGQPQVAVQHVVDLAKVENEKHFGLEFIDLGGLLRTAAFLGATAVIGLDLPRPSAALCRVAEGAAETVPLVMVQLPH